MNARLLFVVGAPRSGTTMLTQMLGAHSMIRGGPEPHLLTPLAHLGLWARVDKAPYDHIVAALGQQAFVESLPNGRADYWEACRAYCDLLYGRFLEASGKLICLDKTPEYVIALPFITKVFPDASYVVLTRHPAAILSSFANSFFDGDFQIAHAHDPIPERYIPAIAAFLRQDAIPFIHVRYEDLVADPDLWMRRIYGHIGVPFEAESLEYGRGSEMARFPDGLGDPLGVKEHRRPSTASVTKWTREVTRDQETLRFVKSTLDRIAPEDLATFGYPAETLWEPLEKLGTEHRRSRDARRLTPYRLQRKLIVRGRSLVQKTQALAQLLRRVRLACDVLLREYS